MSLRYNTGCAVQRVNAEVVCWGAGGSGGTYLGVLGKGPQSSSSSLLNLGDDAGEMTAITPIDLGTGRTAKSVNVYAHACAVLDDDTVKCWGYNQYGQLGLGDTGNRGDAAGEMGDSLPTVDLGTGRTAKSVVVGAAHTCAVLDDDKVKCWGVNQHGQLGLGDTTTRGAFANQMGDNLPYVDLGTGRTANMMCANDYHSCALLDNGDVKCWGYNQYAHLGQGDVSSRGDNAGEMGDNLNAINFGAGRTAKFISCGVDHNCAILDNDNLICWGIGSKGQLGQDNAFAYGDASRSVASASAINLGVGRHAKMVAAGLYHTCAILDDGNVKCWGDNTHGELGYDDTMQRGKGASGYSMTDLVAVNLGAGRTARWLTAGDYNTCAVLDDDQIKCWGRGTYAALGQDNTKRYGTVSSATGNDEPISAVVALPDSVSGVASGKREVVRMCDASVAPTNGGVGDCTFNLGLGTTCQPTCDTGYTVSGVTSCSAAGVLTSATCERICDASTAPANGAVGTCTNALAAGSTCQPTCNAGYTVSGVTSCSAAGVLTEAMCNPPCDASAAPANGAAGDCTALLARGSTCQPTCNAGYTVSGVSSCSAAGVLTEAMCNPPCDASAAPANGAVGDCTALLARGSTCQPTCNAGYTVSGVSSCSAAGVLTEAMCNPPCDASAAPANGAVGDCTALLARGSTCQPTCNAGYTVSGVSSCSAAGVLTAATCQSSADPNAPCDASRAPANGAVGDCTALLARGSTCQPTCNAGYTVSGVTSCSADGVLTAAMCNPPCDASAAPLNGAPGDCTALLARGSTCQPDCNPGYTVSGVTSCSADGVLTAAMCNPPCDASAAPLNGAPGDCTALLARGSTCQPDCNPGYTVSGVSTCSADGVLTEAVCNPPCDASAAPANGAAGTCTALLARGSTCQPTCNAGYTVSGVSTCSADGVLTEAVCYAPCNASTAPTNGAAGDCTNVLAHGSTCQPTCNSGYDASGPTSCTDGELVATTCSLNSNGKRRVVIIAAVCSSVGFLICVCCGVYCCRRRRLLSVPGHKPIRAPRPKPRIPTPAPPPV